MSTFKNYNGETKTRALEGTAFGAILGLFLGLGLCIWIFSVRPDIAFSFKVVAYFVLTLGASTVFGFAGSLVGIGVPKFNPDPEQGLINRLHQQPLVDKLGSKKDARV